MEGFKMDKTILKKYANLIVKVGANVQEGQEVRITSSVDDAYFTKYVVEEAYKAGAKRVEVEWTCQAINKLDYTYQDVDTICDFRKWQEEKWQWTQDHLPVMIYISSEDPDGMKGVDQSKIQQRQMRVGPQIMKYRLPMEGKYQWTIAGIPGQKWANKVFPDMSNEEAMDALWKAILKVTRVNGDPIQNWKEHDTNLNQKTTWLNSLGIKTLTYKSSNGTDFTVDIDERLTFMAGGESTRSGIFFQPNMPTEECFTSPIKTSANGVVYATKPLSIRGVLAHDFGFRFNEGKVVEVLANDPVTKEVLENLVATDEGSAMLGEVALVPYDSPINQTGILFYNTLYDENACCHLALGRGFEECIKDYASLTEEEIKAVDINTSISHVDFMIGSPDLSIVATCYNGDVVEIFKDGTWVK